MIGYIINTILNINKAFREQVNKCMKNTFCTITQPHIRTILAKSNIRVLALFIFMRKDKILRKMLKC